MSTRQSSEESARGSGPDDTERRVRVELAACYRIFDMLGWTELIFNHITAKVPGTGEHFLINPFGLLYSEVTASNLVKVDLQGDVVGQSEWPINRAGFVIHSAIHGARPDVTCIMHTHTTTGMAVACLEQGLTQTNFYSAMLEGAIAYHPFEGVTNRPDEGPRLVASLGDKNIMILRNHGLLACGTSIAEAFGRLWRLQRACDVQVTAASTGGRIIPISPEAAGYSTARANGVHPGATIYERVFAALKRRLDVSDPGYRA